MGSQKMLFISVKLKSNFDFHCRRCLEVVIEPNVKLECVPKFCYYWVQEVWRRQQELE